MNTTPVAASAPAIPGQRVRVEFELDILLAPDECTVALNVQRKRVRVAGVSRLRQWAATLQGGRGSPGPRAAASAWRLGYRVGEVPITFEEHYLTSSKITKGIIWEAIWRIPLLRLTASKRAAAPVPVRAAVPPGR